LGLVAILIASPILAKQFFLPSPKKANHHLSSPTVEPAGEDDAAQLGAHHTPAPTLVPAPAHATVYASATAALDPCMNKLIATPQKPPRHGEALFVVADEVNLRAGSSLDCQVLSTLPFGAQVVVTGAPVTHDGITWRRVRTENHVGYVADFTLREPDLDATMNTAIPVLMYHLISEHEARFAVTPDELNEQMAWLRDNGYTSLTPSDVLKAVTEGIPLPDKPIMITVDDGYASDLLFAEIVTSYGFRPVFFWPNYADLTPDDMRWLASLGEACGHTVSHARLREMGWTAQLDEIGPNKDWIEGILGYPINCFAYPFGSYDQTSTDVVAYVGYQIAFDAWGMRSVVGSLDPYHISRKEIDGDFDLATFQAILAGGAQ
jgi:peptidoglycan/xylan/chitin deacetylase (PgdA/CDA1 family)